MKSVPGFPNYSVTKIGQVWSRKRPGTKGGLGLLREDKDGYLCVALWKNSKGHMRRVHRLVLETFVSPRPEGMECRHLNGDRRDNRLENLKWGTKSENQQDAIRHGTAGKHGEESPVSKLSNRDRRLIIYLYSTGLFTHRELAKLYSVSESTITNLVTGERWPFIDARKIRGAAHV